MPRAVVEQSERSPRATKTQKGPASTFKSTDLEQAFIRFCQITESHPTSSDPLDVRIRKRLRCEIEFIGNPGFASDQSEREVLGDVLLGTGIPAPASKPARVPDLPAHLRRMCETRLLQPEEERSLFQRMNFLRFRAQCLQSKLDPKTSTEWDLVRIEGLLRVSNWYRDQIVKANMRLVMSITKKFVNSNNCFDDLLSDGAMALMRAVDKFDYDRGFRFSTYATQVVRRNAYRTVMQRQNDKLRTAVSTDEPGVDLCEQSRVGMDEGKWHELRTRLSVMLDQLDRREKLIIRARFSLGGHRRVQTLQRLADALGVSKERVRQLEKRALEKLRGLVEAAPLPESDSMD